MKRTTKIVMGVAAGVLLSSAIGGITAYKLLERQQNYFSRIPTI